MGADAGTHVPLATVADDGHTRILRNGMYRALSGDAAADQTHAQRARRPGAPRPAPPPPGQPAHSLRAHQPAHVGRSLLAFLLVLPAMLAWYGTVRLRRASLRVRTARLSPHALPLASNGHGGLTVVGRTPGTRRAVLRTHLRSATCSGTPPPRPVRGMRSAARPSPPLAHGHVSSVGCSSEPGSPRSSRRGVANRSSRRRRPHPATPARRRTSS